MAGSPLVGLFSRLALTKSPACLSSVWPTAGGASQYAAARFATKTTETKQKSGQQEGSPAPNRPANSYILFSKDYRAELKQKGTLPSLTKEFAPMCSVAWQNLDSIKKNAYETRFKQDKLRYQQEMDAYKQTLPPEKPKRALSAYNIFIAETMKRIAGTNHKVTSKTFKLVAERWPKMTPFQKNPYLSKSKLDAAEKAKQLIEYNKAMGLHDKPKRPSSPWNFYFSEFCKTPQGQSTSQVERMQKASEQWNKLTEQQKEPYNSRSAQERQRYEREMEAWRAKNEN